MTDSQIILLLGFAAWAVVGCILHAWKVYIGNHWDDPFSYVLFGPAMLLGPVILIFMLIRLTPTGAR